MKLWVKYDKSPQRLPIAVADSARELARITGMSLGNVRTIASKVKHGQLKDGTVRCVEVDDEESC